MEIIRAKTYEDAWEQVQDRRARDSDGDLYYTIVESSCGGYSIIVVNRQLMADMLIGEVPMLSMLKRRRASRLSEFYDW